MLACVVNLALNCAKTIIDLLELSLESFNILADRREASLNLTERVSVSTIVTSHALEVS